MVPYKQESVRDDCSVPSSRATTPTPSPSAKSFNLSEPSSVDAGTNTSDADGGSATAGLSPHGFDSGGTVPTVAQDGPDEEKGAPSTPSVAEEEDDGGFRHRDDDDQQHQQIPDLEDSEVSLGHRSPAGHDCSGSGGGGGAVGGGHPVRDLNRFKSEVMSRRSMSAGNGEEIQREQSTDSGGRSPVRRELIRTLSEQEVVGQDGRDGGGGGGIDLRYSRKEMILKGIASRDSFRRLKRLQEEEERKAVKAAEKANAREGDDGEVDGATTTDDESEESDSEEEEAYLDIPEVCLLEEGQNYLAMSMLVYIYALLREMALLGYTETDFRAIDVNRWERWYEHPHDEDSTDGESCRIEEDERSIAQSTLCSVRTRKKHEKYLKNTRTAGSIIRCVLEELEREHQNREEQGSNPSSGAGQHDISVIKEFQHWVDDSRGDQEDDVAEKAIKELQRQVAKKRWKNAVQAVMARSRFKFILAAAKAAKEAEREEREGKKEEELPEETVREKMERKKEAVRRQLEIEMKKGGSKNVNSWFTMQKRVIETHFDDEAHEDDEAREENAKRRPNQTMIDKVVEESLPSFFKAGSVLNLMMEQGIEVAYFGDRHPNEAIYCLCVNRPSRTITVVFRGSVTAHNWMYNMKLMMSNQPNPLARENYEGRSDFVKLHTGFGLYMLRKRKDTGQTKICEIFERIDRVGRELAADGRYRVAVAGHSLGGALSTIFSFYAACDKRFTTLGPVRTFTFAAPRVGDERFRFAYERLERTGRLRHARFSNMKDIVPLTPTFSLNGTRVGPWYKHVGLQIKLQETTGLGKLAMLKAIDATYPRNKAWNFELTRALKPGNNFLFNLTTLTGFGKNHSLSEHQRRLNFTYQYRRNLLESDLRHDKKKRMKSLEEYYRIKAGIGGEPFVKEQSVADGRRFRKVVVIVVVISALSVLVYGFVSVCPIGNNMRTQYCTDGGWYLLCGRDTVAVEVLEKEVKRDTVVEVGEYVEDEETTVDPKEEILDDKNATETTLGDEAQGCACQSPLAATASDHPGWGFSPSRVSRRSAPVLGLLPVAQERAVSFARRAENQARVEARGEVDQSEVEAKMASMLALGQTIEGPKAFSNTPGHVLGPLLLHVAGRVIPFVPLPKV